MTRHRLAWVVALFFAISLSASAAGVRVDRFVLSYGKPHPALPPIEQLASREVKLELRDGVYFAPAPGQGAPVKLGDSFPNGRFDETALVVVFQAIVADLNARGIYGVFVTPSREELDPQTREDFRTGENRSLTLVVWASEVGQIRSVAKGDRFPADRSINNRRHRRIVSHSPLRPATGNKPGSLLKKLALDDYLQRLNRHPGRRVEAAISSTSDPGSVVLDYLVNEKRAWFLYGQVSNTGTDATSKFRERIGFTETELTNHDDVLSLDFITSSITAGNAGFFSYDFPLIYPDVLRVKALASYGNFTAKDIGVALEEFTGSSWSAGLEATWSPFRFWNFSFDATLGAAWQKVEVNNRTIGLRGKAPMLTPYFLLKLERQTETAQTNFQVGVETNLADVAGTTAENIFALGRLQTDVDYLLLKVEFSQSMYLEPLLFHRDFDAGQNWRRATRAHEVAFVFRGQQVLDDKRLVPQKQLAIGGMFSIRGYPESVSGGDNVAYLSSEYRLHVPRLLRPYTGAADPLKRRASAPPTYFGRPFYWRPSQVYALPDWDLILRGFFDAGYTQIVRPRPEEANRKLLGAGVGVEVQAAAKLSLRADLGFALEHVKTGNANVRPGSSQLHLMASWMW